MGDELLKKVLGCVIGATIGDSIGAVVEFKYRDEVLKRLNGKEWVEDMHPFGQWGTHPLGIFSDRPPRGTGTDDTRLNQLFLECVIKGEGFVNSQLLAMEYLERHRSPETYYPKTPDLGREHMNYFYSRCCAHLGMRDAAQPEEGIFWTYLNDLNGIPRLAGLLSLQSVGLLFQDEPEEAYRKAVELDFFDIGYATDATALLAATVSAALSEEDRDAREVLEIGIKTNPFQLGGPDGKARRMTGHDPLLPNAASLPGLFEAVDGAKDDREAVLALARECRDVHPFDPLDVLGVPLAMVRYTNGDPVRSILMAANHRLVDEEGNLIRTRDVDCVAMVAGVLVGAINGIDAFPKDWVDAAISANREVYGFDIMNNARRFASVVHGREAANDES